MRGLTSSISATPGFTARKSTANVTLLPTTMANAFVVCHVSATITLVAGSRGHLGYISLSQQLLGAFNTWVRLCTASIAIVRFTALVKSRSASEVALSVGFNCSHHRPNCPSRYLRDILRNCTSRPASLASQHIPWLTLLPLVVPGDTQSSLYVLDYVGLARGHIIC